MSATHARHLSSWSSKFPRGWRWLRRVFAIAVGVLLLAFVLDRLFPLHLPAPDTGSTVVLARDGT
ncbi:hypothetical protein HFP05_12720, partial [Rhodanobacter denitrificans]|nr:hypothetical protein [Rhodanobacter denitrificans]